MTRARALLVSAHDTPYYHCIGRCVRRAYLCGQDPVSGRSFDHRKGRMLERLKLLTEVFTIDLCAYALMSNHYHLVVRLAPERAGALTEREVIERWRRLYTGPACVARYLDGARLDAAESALVGHCVALWRERLADLSWFMRCLNEYLARAANLEDGCTGRFWEGRFKSQALLDEQAVLTAMAYVDLNPVRAGLADSVAASDFTSAQQRLGAIVAPTRRCTEAAPPDLIPFAESSPLGAEPQLPFTLQDYLELLDSTGRVVHPQRRGAIPPSSARLLEELGLEPGEWLRSVAALQARFRLFIGAPQRVSSLAEQRGWRWIRGQSALRRLYRRVTR